MQICRASGGCTALYPCKTPQAVTEPEVLAVDRGHLDLYLEVSEVGGVWIDAPRVLYRVVGELDGVAFEQVDYFRMGYAYTAHGLDREVLVMFDDPIGDACGLWGEYGRDGKESLFTIDCDGNWIDDLGPVEVTVP